MKLFKSIQWALHGIRTTWREERNFRIEIALAVLVVALGIRIHVLLLEWIILAGCIGAVLAAEMLNTAVEDLCDKVEPHQDRTIGKIKDIMAGFVFIVATVAGAITIIIFVDYLF